MTVSELKIVLEEKGHVSSNRQRIILSRPLDNDRYQIGACSSFLFTHHQYLYDYDIM
jgi:hypothetical protein